MYPADYLTVVLSANAFNKDGSLDVEGAYLSFSGKAATFTNANHKLFYKTNGYATFDHYAEVHQHLAVVLVLGYKQDSVSQNEDWTVFNLGTGYALATRKVDKTISATAQYGYLYFCEYRFNAPDIYDSILYADVKPVTGNGLWFGHYREINNTSTIVCYFSSATSMSKVGMCVQETVIGKLK